MNKSNSFIVFLFFAAFFARSTSRGFNASDVLNSHQRNKRHADYQLITLDSLQRIAIEPVVVECTKNHKKSAAKLHQESLTYFCNKPRKQLITVKMPSQEFAYFPMAIEIDRCEGLCHLPNSRCRATDKETITIPVQEVKVTPVLMSSSVNVLPKCLEYKVDKHLKCKCECMITADNCTAEQEFVENSCRCVCKKNMADDCVKSSKVWNARACRCECPGHLSRDCSSGYEFNENSCTCEVRQT